MPSHVPSEPSRGEGPSQGASATTAQPSGKTLFAPLQKPAPASFAELFARLGISFHMRLEAFDPRRSYQLKPAEELCSFDRNSFLLADTGTGKTVVGAIEVGRVLKAEKVALIVTPEEHLLKQWRGVLLRTLHIQPEEIFLCSGSSLRSRKAGDMLGAGIRVVIATPEALVRDLASSKPRIDMSRVGRAILDEADLIEGKTDYAKLYARLVEQQTKRTLMSATVSGGYRKSVKKLHDLGIGIADVVVMRGPKGQLYDRVYRLPMRPDVRYPAECVLASYRHCLYELRKQILTLHPTRNPAAAKLLLTMLHAHELPSEVLTSSMTGLQKPTGLHIPPTEAARSLIKDPTVEAFLLSKAEPLSMKSMKQLTALLMKAPRHMLKEHSAYSEEGKAARMIVSLGAELQHLNRMYNLVTTSKVAFMDFVARHFGDTVSPIPKKRLLFVSRAFVLCRDELKSELTKEGERGVAISAALDEASPIVDRKQMLPSGRGLQKIMQQLDQLCREKSARLEDTRFLRNLQRELKGWGIAYLRLVGVPRRDAQGEIIGWQGARTEILVAGVSPDDFRLRSAQVVERYKTGIKRTKGGTKIVDLKEADTPHFLDRIYRRDTKISEAIKAVAWGLEKKPEARQALDRDRILRYASLFARGAWKAVCLDFPMDYGDEHRDYTLDPASTRANFLDDCIVNAATKPLEHFVDSTKDAALHGLPIEGHDRLAYNEFGRHLLKGRRSFMFIGSPALAQFQAIRIEALHLKRKDLEQEPEVEASLLLGKKVLSPKERDRYLARFRDDTGPGRKTIVTNKTRGTDIPGVDEAIIYVPVADVRSLHQFRGRTSASRSMERGLGEVTITALVQEGTPEERSLDFAMRRYAAMLKALGRLRTESEAARAS